jgi:hypothetical protein
LKSQIENRGLAQFEMQPAFTQIGEDTIIGSTQWVDADGVRGSRCIVLTIEDGKISDMQACASMRQAKRFARRVRS